MGFEVAYGAVEEALSVAAAAGSVYVATQNKPKLPSLPGVPSSARVDQSQQAAVDNERRKQAIAGGISSTTNTGPGGTNPGLTTTAQSGAKTLLGQ